MTLKARAARSLEYFAPALAGRIDWNRKRPDLPVNGQRIRQAMIREIVSALQPRRIIETGTRRGASTIFLWACAGVPVYSSDIRKRYLWCAHRRLLGIQEVQAFLCDSTEFLTRLATQGETEGPTLFYLDAHGEDHLPLAEEIVAIWEHWEEAVVMIDDFQVPDDPGYGFDDYGREGALTLDYLPSVSLTQGSAFFPSAPSEAETGPRRGCIVLAKPTLTPMLEGLHSLRGMSE